MADFETTCVDKKEHSPASYDASHTQCTKCNQEIYLTNEGSGYYFTDEDCKMWDIQYNGEIDEKKRLKEFNRLEEKYQD